VLAVVDPGVVVAGLLAPGEQSAAVLGLWMSGAFDLVVCPRWLAELEATLSRPALRSRITIDETAELLDLLRSDARIHDDPAAVPVAQGRRPDAANLVILAAATRAALVSADRHLLELRQHVPVHTPGEFVQLAEALEGSPRQSSAIR